jgi:hypothetical protein
MVVQLFGFPLLTVLGYATEDELATNSKGIRSLVIGVAPKERRFLKIALDINTTSMTQLNFDSPVKKN